MEFKDQYRHPNWQKKRLEALESAHFVCQLCGSDEDTLHVHHKRYVKGRKVWEYDKSELSVLCEGCHAEAHLAKEALNEIMARLHPEGLADVVALVAGYCSNVSGPAYVDYSGIAGFYELSPVPFYAGAEAAYAQPEMCRKFAEEIRAKNNG